MKHRSNRRRNKKSKPNTIRVYLVHEHVDGQGVLRVTPRRGIEPAPDNGKLVAELPNEMMYQMLQRQLREMAAADGLLCKNPHAHM